jgi:hypothetical protein
MVSGAIDLRAAFEEEALGNERRELADLLVDVVPSAPLDRIVRFAALSSFLANDSLSVNK